jgi:DNA-binding IclR family transcriptional regulator
VKECTEDDLLAAVISSMRETEESGLTITDIAELTGVCRPLIHRQLKKMMEQDKVEVVRFKRYSLTGTLLSLKGFRLKAKGG